MNRAPGATCAYLIALAVGILAVTYALPWATLTGAGLFRYPVGDLPTNLIGHLAFQAPGWHWPLLRAPDLAWPQGESIAMTDSNPALSLLAKLLASLLGHPVNLFGLWLALCLLLQPLAAVYAMRGLGAPSDNASALNNVAAAFTASLLVLLLPEYLFRIIHINLLGQFLLLAALGLAARGCATGLPPSAAAIGGLLALAIFVHPYLFIFCALMLAAPALQSLRLRAPTARAALRTWAICVQAPVLAFLLLSGGLGGGGGPGFGLYSMNLLGPVWPQRSGLFGANLPILDATGYQHEGFNYLGAGTLFLLACAVAALLRDTKPRREAISKRLHGVMLVLAALTALAITPHLSLGTTVLLPVQSALLDRMFAVVRASGRAIWLVDYTLLLGAIGLLASRLRPRLFLPAMLAVLVLQWIDAAPLRQAALLYFAGTGQAPPPLTIPPGTTLFTVVPLCSPEDVVADESRLLALRAGAHLSAARLAHPPLPAACAQALASGMTTDLAPGEARLFLPSVQAGVKRAGCVTSAAGLLCR